MDLPVLSPQDIKDVQDFAALNGMDFVAASFVQSGKDVRFIRKVWIKGTVSAKRT